ncbi:PDCL3 [Acrasis kona]|uniref:PDCL3 n=1 Tax=Acrasis kona TaxID=1008807 RepID=A0AAW2YTG6_9EUKA
MAKINGIETEWTQILRKNGILPEEEKEEVEFNPEDYKTDQQKKYDILSSKTLEQLSIAEEDGFDDDDEERMFEELKKKRLEQMKLQATKKKHSELREISATEYTQEIKSGPGEYVVLHLYVQAKKECKILDAAMLELSKDHPEVKFLRIRGNAAIPNYPDSNCPTILVYTNDTIAKTWAGLKEFGGEGMGKKELEWKFAEYGIVKTKLKEAPRLLQATGNAKGYVGPSFSFVGQTYGKNYDFEDDETEKEAHRRRMREDEYFSDDSDEM